MSGPLYRAGANWQAEASRLRQAGVSLPISPTLARQQAISAATAMNNRTLTASMNRSRIAAYRGRQFTGMAGSNLQIALPKVRQPMSSLIDKGIPFNVESDEELKTIRMWCRLFYSAHDLVPLLIDIYSKFPITGLEFDHKDPMIKRFYEDMFLGDDLNYLEWLPDQFAREYFSVGEVTSLGHFNESLGVWSSEEILNPDMLRVSRSLFVQRDRVQLMVKELVDTLRDGPMSEGGGRDTEETPSERLQRLEEFKDLQRYYPEVISAAAQDDGLDISDALISRVVNRPTPWARRGAPHLMRSFQTLMAEESLNAAQSAVCVPAGTPVQTSTGLKNIEDVEAGDEVLTHRGRYRRVVAPMTREADEDGVTIRWWYDHSLTLTGEHPVYVRRRTAGAAPGWAEGFIPASEVGVYDQVLYPASPDCDERAAGGGSSFAAEPASQGGHWVKVRAVEHHHIAQTVYNLEVEEDHSYCAPIAVHNCDRLYSPMILATLGSPDLGDGMPWIPSQDELDDTRDDMQAALSADFRLMVHNFGLRVESVFGRESVPNLDNDYGRVERKLLQAWGIGEALISGGTGGAYASSALNREFVTQIMTGFQNSLKRHIRKRAEIVAEAQGHYDFDMKGGVRQPVWREIVETDPNTGEEYLRKVPKLAIPDVKFSCVVPGTQVLTPTGQRNVEDIRPGDEVIAWDGTGYVVDTALHTGIEYRDRLVEVTTATGRAVRCTTDHPFWTDQGWMRAEDLTVDSLIRTSAGHLSACVDSDDDLDLLRFLGLLAGGGNCSATHVSLSVGDLGVDAFVCEQAERMGLTARRKADPRTDKVWYRMFARPATWKESTQNPLHTLLREQGMWGDAGRTKRVPPLVWQAGEKGRAAFLSGYFDADGHACRTSGLRLASTDRALLDDCQVVFESLGIRAQVQSHTCRHEGQKAGVRSINHLTVSNSSYFQMLRDAMSPMIGSKTAALDDMARPSTGGKAPCPVEWDQVTAVVPLDEGGDIVTLGITSTHTHVTAGLVSHNTLNLRDESQERAFIAQLKAMGVPVSDKMLAVNIDIEFSQELERQADESVSKMMATAQAMRKVQTLCDQQNLPYPPELAQHLMSTLQLRQGKSQTELAEAQSSAGEAQAEFQEEQIGVQRLMLEQQLAQSGMAPPGAEGGGAPSPEGGGGLPPGQQPDRRSKVPPDDPTTGPQGPGGPGGAGPQGAGPQGGMPGMGGPGAPPMTLMGALNVQGPSGTAPFGVPPAANLTGPELPPGMPEPTEIPRNRTRPAESDTMRGYEPKQVGASRRPTRFEAGPSTYGSALTVSQDQVREQVGRLEAVAAHRARRDVRVHDLVGDPDFYRATNHQGHQSQIQGDWAEIQAGGAPDSRRVLDDMLDQYAEIFGVEPSW